jgi:acetyl-CoA acyltransferase
MQAFVAGTAMTAFSSRSPGLVALAQEAALGALADAGIDGRDVGLVFVANAAAGLIQGQEMVRGEVLLQGTSLAGRPIVNVENACASSSTGFFLASGAVASGQTHVALVVGVEEMSHPDRLRTFGALASATDTVRRPDMRRLVERFALGQGEREDDDMSSSPLMRHYAEKGSKYLAEVGGDASDLARIVVKSRSNAAASTRAQLRRPTTVEEVLADRLIADPLTRSMCAPVSNGAAAIVLTSGRRSGTGPAVRVLASSLVTNDVSLDREPVPIAAAQAYAQAGLGPDELDLVEVHDAAASAELIAMEGLGLCPPGTAVEWVRAGLTGRRGRLPVNVAGGLLSRGHPLGATGCAQLVELTAQLRGRAGALQLDRARVGLAQNSGGVLGEDEAVTCVTILRVDE